MGAVLSSPKKNISTSKCPAEPTVTSESEMIRLMMPLYYSIATLTDRDRLLASKTWQLILNNESPEYIHQKETNTAFQYEQCMEFFFDSFYFRLFDIHPASRALFKSSMQHQGNFLVKMISLSLSETEDPRIFDMTLRKLAEIHYQRGVKAFEYGIVGEVLFWALKHVLGTKLYTSEVHFAWVKIYNRMLQIIMPVAVSLELHPPPATTFLTATTNDRYMLGCTGTPSQKSDCCSRREEKTVHIHQQQQITNGCCGAWKSEQLRGAEECPASYVTTPTLSASTSRQTSGEETTLITHRIVWSTI